jgi:CheY-like chemotaxis protein
MTPAKRPIAHEVLLVDDDEAVHAMMSVTLERNGLDVVEARRVQHEDRLAVSVLHREAALSMSYALCNHRKSGRRILNGRLSEG